MMKSGFCTLIGPPNAGKSTLMNQLLEYPLTIVSPKPQTTRNSILGIYHGEGFQIIFNDTPGLLKKKNSLLDKEMERTIHRSLEGTDIILFLIDVNESLEPYHPVLEKIKETSKAHLLVVFNKIDTNPSASSQISCPYPHLFISGQQGTQVSALLEQIQFFLKEDVEYFPKDMFSNRTERFFVKEYIRETLLEHLHQEIPHSAFVDVEKMDESREDLVHIQAIIYLERESHKKIVIGKKGSMIKNIGVESRAKIERLLGKKIFLECLVKVHKNWSDNPQFLKKLEYY